MEHLCVFNTPATLNRLQQRRNEVAHFRWSGKQVGDVLL
jgi:hypothetical protein